MTTGRVERTTPATVFGDIARSTRELALPRDPIWIYPTPIAPSVEPDDYVSGWDVYPIWESPWSNISVARPPTAFKLVEGNLALRVAATGGEAIPNSLMFTLPEGFRPIYIERHFASVGALGERVGAIEAHPDGTVLFLGSGELF